MNFLRRLFGGRSKAAPPDVTPEKCEQNAFARRIVAALADANPESPVDYDPDAFELRHEDDRRTFLANMFADYARSSETEREGLIARFVAFIQESGRPLPTGEAALDLLLPVLRSRADMLVQFDTPGLPPYEQASRPFCETMVLLLAIDLPTAISIVTDDILAEIGISFDDALGLATAQLDERGNHVFEQLDDGVFVTVCDDAYDASRVLLPGLFSQLPLRGNPVAIVESRSAVLVTGSEDREGLARIAEIAWKSHPENGRAISLTPIELVDGTWRPLTILPNHPRQLRNLVQYQRSWSYGVTEDPLQKLLGDDIYVASVLLIENDEGIAATAASWAAGVPTACPQTDAIVVEAEDDFPEITRSFDDVVSACGPFPVIDELSYPPRILLPATLDAEKRRVLTGERPHHDLFPD